MFAQVFRPNELQKFPAEREVRVVARHITVGEWPLLLFSPASPEREHLQQIAAVLLKAHQQPAKVSHPVQNKLAKLLQKRPIEMRRRHGIEVGEDIGIVLN